MTKYEAIMAAADFIERNPKRYGFAWGKVPEDEGGRGCMIAWIGFHLGMRGQESYTVMGELTGSQDIRPFMYSQESSRDGFDFVIRPDKAAEHMRKFARQFKPAKPIAPTLDPAFIAYRATLKWPAKIAACLLLVLGAAVAHAQTLQLATPYLVPLNPVVSVFQCAAWEATTDAYKTVITGFSADGNYVQGQVISHFTCGHSGRGANIHTTFLCTTLTWDLSGNLVSTSTPTNGKTNISCAVTPLNLPSTVPPSSEVVGNEFTNAGGYMAETLVQEICGSQACYETLLFPALLTP